MFNFFEIAREFDLPILNNFSQAPITSGYYMLFGERGNFIYVGKATNLRQRLLEHFSLSEQNIKIKLFARFAIWVVTNSIREAEQLEGEIFDRWVRFTGKYPFANEIQPPKATLTSKEVLRIKIRSLLNR